MAASDQKEMITPIKRLERMRESFENDKSVLAEDYRYFTTPDAPVMPRASIPQSKAVRKSAERSGRQSRERSETPSSGRTDD
jgi:hypothetical protein